MELLIFQLTAALYLLKFSCIIDQIFITFYFRIYSKSPWQPSVTSFQVASKSPVYHGSATSLLLPEKRHHLKYLSLWISTCDPLYITYIPFIHSDQIIIPVIICPGHLSCMVSFTGNSRLGKLNPGTLMNRISNLFCGSGSRCYIKLIWQICFFYNIFHYVFCHWGTQMLPWQTNKILIFLIFPVFFGLFKPFYLSSFSLILAYFGISLHIFVINFGKTLVNFKSVPKANLPLGIDR